MTDRRVLPCPNCGVVGCWDHCHNCGDPVVWRPPGLDREIHYDGPKPLNMDGSHHDRCAHGSSKKKTGDPIIDNTNFTKEQAYFLNHGYKTPYFYYSPEDIEGMKSEENKIKNEG